MRPSSTRPTARGGFRRPIRAVATGCAALALAAAVAGCGEAIDPRKTEIAVQYDVEEATGVTVDHVTCPEGVAVEAGNRFSCRVVTVGGDAATAELEVTNESADLRLIRLREP